MKAPVLFLLAIATPIILCLTLFGPSYGSVFGATYLVYGYGGEAQAQTIADRAYDVFYVLNAYSQLVHYWSANHATLGTVKYTLPIIGLPAVGLILSLWLTRRITRKIFNLFHLSARVH
jgi:hypothetical protein